MSATVQSFRRSTRAPERTPEREALARAIDNHASAKAELARLQKAQQRAETLVMEAWGRKESAEREMKEAAERETVHTVAVLLDEAAAEQSPVRAANVALAQAETTLEDARAARIAVTGAVDAAGRRVQLTGMLLSNAVAAAVRTDPATARLIARYRDALKTAVGLRRALQHLSARDCLAHRSWASEEAWPELPGAAPWEQALAALETNPDAPLPC